MLLKSGLLRLALTILYFATCYGILFYYTYGSPFCVQPDLHAIETARLAIACTAWDLFASICGLLVACISKKVTSGIAPFVATLTAGIDFVYLPFWMFQGYGHFRFEYTWNMNCFFTEASGMVFPFVVSPVFTLMTLFREWLVIRMQRRLLAASLR
jgi:hypothetical protein